ncbi:MAG: hypothetical protein H7249_10270 [Chitinophagaceae bacterium]|nr:hypothetical protein [Oligoflexus sp.]
MNHKRMKLTFLFVSIAELVNKFIPIFMLRLGNEKLSTENLGLATFGTSIVEIFLPFMIWGFEISGPLSLRGIDKGSEEWKKRIGDILGARLALGICVYLVMTLALYVWPDFFPYRSIAMLVGLGLIFSSLGTTFVHTADQSLAVLARITIGAKFASLALAYLLVRDSGDWVMFALLNFGVNVIVSLGSLTYVVKTYGYTRPRFDHLIKTIAPAMPYALTYIGAGVVEKIEVLYVQRIGGATAAGAIAGPLKLYQGLLFMVIALSAVSYSEGLAYPEKIGRFLRLTVWMLAVVILPLMIGVFFVGEPLLTTIFSSTLSGSGGLNSFAGQGLNLAFICTGMLGHSLLLVAGVQALSALGKIWWTNAAYAGAFVLGIVGSEILMRGANPSYALLAPAFGKNVAGIALFIFACRQTEGFKTLKLPMKGIGAGLFVMFGFLWFTPDVNWIVRLISAAVLYGVCVAVLSLPLLRKIIRKEGLQ